MTAKQSRFERRLVERKAQRMERACWDCGRRPAPVGSRRCSVCNRAYSLALQEAHQAHQPRVAGCPLCRAAALQEARAVAKASAAAIAPPPWEPRRGKAMLEPDWRGDRVADK